MRKLRPLAHGQELVGRNFARLRREKGPTEEDVQARFGFSQQYLSGLARARWNPTVIALFELPRVLGVSHVELVEPDDKA